jgi:voltage-gated potassium channel
MFQVKPRPFRLTTLGLSLVLVVLVAAAIANVGSVLFASIVAAAGIAVVAVRRLFPKDRLLSIAFSNLIAVYACIFALFVEESFNRVSAPILGLGFALPLLLFISGCWLQREAIRKVVAGTALATSSQLSHALFWLVPVSCVGAGILVLSRFSQDVANTNAAFLGAMGLIGLIVFSVSKNVATFLIDTGLLFEEFFARAANLVIPAFAFLTFYSLLVIVFAAIYCILSHYAGGQHFEVAHAHRTLSFGEALYFSVVTLSTVGYGDILPTSNIARVLASIQVVLGVILLLFGVSEILVYARERRR